MVEVWYHSSKANLVKHQVFFVQIYGVGVKSIHKSIHKSYQSNTIRTQKRTALMLCFCYSYTILTANRYIIPKGRTHRRLCSAAHRRTDWANNYSTVYTGYAGYWCMLAITVSRRRVVSVSRVPRGRRSGGRVSVQNAERVSAGKSRDEPNR